MLKRTIRKLQQLFQTAKFCSKIAPVCSVKYFNAFLRATRLCHKNRFQPEEAFHFGLFNPDLPESELSKYVSRRNLTKIQEARNPVSWAPLLKDKGILYHYCMASGIPIPKLYAIFFRKTAGWSYDGSFLRNRDDWKRFFNGHLPAEFVIKPAQGSVGSGVKIFCKTEDGFADTFGESYTSEQIYNTMFSNSAYDSFVIQECLKNHPELVRLSNTRFLQTVRIITFIDKNNQFHILHAMLKVIACQSVTDNIDLGRTGNISAEISLGDGVLKPAVGINPNGSGIRTILNHPKTGLSFDQFKLPLWNQARRLVEETAPRFLPLRTIGWDVALTPNGPLILEGNIWWDAPNQYRCMDIFLDKLSR